MNRELAKYLDKQPYEALTSEEKQLVRDFYLAEEFRCGLDGCYDEEEE